MILFCTNCVFCYAQFPEEVLFPLSNATSPNESSGNRMPRELEHKLTDIKNAQIPHFGSLSLVDLGNVSSGGQKFPEQELDSHQGQKHLSFFNINFVHPHPKPPLLGSKKKLMCLISWEGRKKGTHINLLRRIWG